MLVGTNNILNSVFVFDVFKETFMYNVLFIVLNYKCICIEVDKIRFTRNNYKLGSLFNIISCSSISKIRPYGNSLSRVYSAYCVAGKGIEPGSDWNMIEKHVAEQ